MLRREDGHILRRALHFYVERQRKKGMPKRTWKKKVKEESTKIGLIRENAFLQSNWSVGFNLIATRQR